MEIETSELIPLSDLADLTTGQQQGHVLCALCLHGTASFTAMGRHNTVTKGDLMVKPGGCQLTDISASEGFRLSALLVSERLWPQQWPVVSDAGEGLVLHIAETDAERCRCDIDAISQRLRHPYHSYYADALRRCVELLAMDVHDIHARTTGQAPESVSQSTRLLQRLVAYLQEGRYKKERSVEYYASLLGITAKYLSEACVASSGHNASYWIERFTIDEIARQLADRDKPLTDIAADLSFSSLSYLSRYIKRAFGCTPSEYRQRLK